MNVQALRAYFERRGGRSSLDSYPPIDNQSSKFVNVPTTYITHLGIFRFTRVKEANPYQTTDNQLLFARRFLLSIILLEKDAHVKGLIEALGHQDKIVRARAADALGRIFRGIGCSQNWKSEVCHLLVVPKLKALLRDRDSDVQRKAQRALDSIKGLTVTLGTGMSHVIRYCGTD